MHLDTLFVSAARPGRDTNPGDSLDVSILRGRHNSPRVPVCCLTLVCQSPNLRTSTQATISVTVESQVCELSMDDLRYTMGPVEKCRGGTCVDKHNVHDVVLILFSST